MATEDPSKIVPQQQTTDHQDKSNLTYPSPPNHHQTSNGLALLHHPSFPSGNPGLLDTVEPPPVQATANNNIQQQYSGLSLPYPSGQEIIASSAQETLSPADNINAALVPGTEPQRQTAPVLPQGHAVQQGQGAAIVSQRQAAVAQRPLSSSLSADPFTGERKGGH